MDRMMSNLSKLQMNLFPHFFLIKKYFQLCCYGGMGYTVVQIAAFPFQSKRHSIWGLDPQALFNHHHTPLLHHPQDHHPSDSSSLLLGRPVLKIGPGVGGSIHAFPTLSSCVNSLEENKADHNYHNCNEREEHGCRSIIQIKL